MTAILENNTISRVTSLDFQDSNLKVNRNANGSVSALINHKEGYREEANNSIKGNRIDRRLVQSKDIAPREEVSVDFAASQWFRILLVHINNRNSKLSSGLEPIPSAILV